MRDLTGKVAWVTGAGTGIGEEGAVALADAGMHVVLSGRRQDKLTAVAARCQGRASIEPLDVSDKTAVAAVATAKVRPRRSTWLLIAVTAAATTAESATYKPLVVTIIDSDSKLLRQPITHPIGRRKVVLAPPPSVKSSAKGSWR